VVTQIELKEKRTGGLQTAGLLTVQPDHLPASHSVSYGDVVKYAAGLFGRMIELRGLPSGKFQFELGEPIPPRLSAEVELQRQINQLLAQLGNAKQRRDAIEIKEADRMEKLRRAEAQLQAAKDAIADAEAKVRKANDQLQQQAKQIEQLRDDRTSLQAQQQQQHQEYERVTAAREADLESLQRLANENRDLRMQAGPARPAEGRKPKDGGAL